jgi:outer membrane receptor protein involved in Fe transport
MNRLVFLPASFLLSLPVLAQTAPDSTQRATAPAGGQRPGGPAVPQLRGKMYGKIIDNASGKPVDGASVTILLVRSAADSASGGILAGTALTEANGEFEIDNIPANGKLNLVITAIGYTAYKDAVSFNLPAMRGEESRTAMLAALNKDLGNLRMLPTGTTQLKEVTVIATTPQFALDGEKKVFNVSQNLNTQGGTVTDVLRNMPGVLVDADGKVSVRNAGPQILVDGRQTTLSLDQIPADAVESLELITNPSAKYDAQAGAGGVLNVVLKKNRRQGYNGNVRAGADTRGGANLGGDFNVRSGKINVSISANGRRNGMITNSLTERLDRYSTPNNFTTQDGVWNGRGYHGFARLGLDYFISNRTTLSAALNKSSGQHNPLETIDITREDLNVATPSGRWAQRNVDGQRKFDMTGISGSLKHLFQKTGQEFTLNVDYNQITNSNNNFFRTDSFTSASHETVFNSIQQKTSGSGKSAFGTLQADYVQPLAEGMKLETGIKATFRKMDNSNNNYTWNAATADYVVLPNPVSDYNSTDQVYAAYASLSGNLGASTSYQVGLRGESSSYEGNLPKTGQSFKNEFPFSLFPSVFVSRKISEQDQVQLSYRRGINRPSFFQLFPFADYSDPLNIRQGNAGLKPEFINTAEVTYLKSWTRSSYGSASAYYRHSAGLISTYQTLATNPFTNDQAVVSTFANLGTSDRYGVELTAQFAPLKWWTILANANGYNAQITTDSSLTNGNNYLSGFAKLSNTFTLPSKVTVQLSGSYQSRTNLLPDNDGGGDRRGGGGGMFGGPSGTAQGYLDHNWFVDLSIRKAWGPKDAMSLTLACNDLFGTRHFIQHTENAYFIQDYDRITNPYTFRLNFSWRFGQADADLFRRRNNRSTSDGDMGGGF